MFSEHQVQIVTLQTTFTELKEQISQHVIRLKRGLNSREQFYEKCQDKWTELHALEELRITTSEASMVAIVRLVKLKVQ